MPALATRTSDSRAGPGSDGIVEGKAGGHEGGVDKHAVPQWTGGLGAGNPGGSVPLPVEKFRERVTGQGEPSGSTVVPVAAQLLLQQLPFLFGRCGEQTGEA